MPAKRQFKLDALVASINSTDMSYLPGLGASGFGIAARTSLASAPQSAIAADLNNDLLPDLIGLNTGGSTLDIFLQQCR